MAADDKRTFFEIKSWRIIGGESFDEDAALKMLTVWDSKLSLALWPSLLARNSEFTIEFEKLFQGMPLVCYRLQVTGIQLAGESQNSATNLYTRQRVPLSAAIWGKCKKRTWTLFNEQPSEMFVYIFDFVILTRIEQEGSVTSVVYRW